MLVMIPFVLAATLALGLPAAESAPPQDVLDLALPGYLRAIDAGEIDPGALLTIIDFSRPSTEERLFVYDPATHAVLHTSLVAHGKNTGEDRAVRFGNEPGSLMSSLGFYATADTYEGKHGYSLRLRGLEPGINDNADERHIVMHGADYVSEAFAAEHGRLGRSWGCPALPDDTAAEVIDLIKDGSCLFVYGADSTYLEISPYIGD